MGSPDFACPTLQKLMDSDHEIVCAYAQPPRPAGRGQKLRPTAVHALAEANNIPVRTPLKLRDDALKELCATPCDAIVVVAYGLLLPQAVLDHAPCLNLHPSALPRWRGAAPLQHTLLHGDDTTEICIMQLDAGMDTGPVYLRESMDVPTEMTLQEIHDITATRGADMMLDVLNTLHERTPEPQEERGMTLAHKITPDMRPIDWNQTATVIHNHIRGLSPFPGATTQCNGETWKILGSALSNGTHNQESGHILKSENGELFIACGEKTVLALTHLQRPSKKAMDVKDFLAGFEFEEKSCFS